MATPPEIGRPARNYPPLALAGLVALLLLALLPSALSLPQSSPGETLEYAPVPPDGETADDPPPGNLSSLGLAASGSIGAAPGGGGEGHGGGAAGDLAGRGKNPSTKRCVGSPPRQTEDLMSPPCVAHFDGDNFGETYQGVSADEVRLALYESPTARVSSKGAEDPTPPGTYIDLAAPPAEDDTATVTMLRTAQRYFNERYQTYGRLVHMWYVTSSAPWGAETPETRRADAIDLFNRIHPFAVLNGAGDYADEFNDVLTRRRVVTFLSKDPQSNSIVGQSASSMAKYPGLLWSYIPSIEERASNFVAMACARVVGRRATFSGNAGENGTPRRLGFYGYRAPDRPDLLRYGALVRGGIEACGGRFEAEGYMTTSKSRNTEPHEATEAQQAMATFKSRGITTVIWAAGSGSAPGDGAQATNYYPEWVIAGDGGWQDSTWGAQLQAQSVWQYARLFTAYTYSPNFESRPCTVAARDADPEANRVDVGQIFCGYYDAIRQVFIGIQVAGPRLTPSSMDKGFHAIPAVDSDHPSAAACFYRPDDYTCVKDAALAWWDPSGVSSNGTQGCWRMYEGAERWRRETWANADIDARRHPEDPCNLIGPGAVSE